MKVIRLSEFKLLLKDNHMMGQALLHKKYLIVVDDRSGVGQECMGLPDLCEFYNLNGVEVSYSSIEFLNIVIFIWYY